MTRMPFKPLVALTISLCAACATTQSVAPPADPAPLATAPPDPAVVAEDAVWTAPRALQLCAGSPQVAAPMTNLKIDHALMDKANPMADFSRQVTPVESMAGWFPAVEAKGLRPLLVTPIMTSAEGPLERVAVVVTGANDAMSEEGAFATLGILALGCAQEGGYEALTPLDNMFNGYALQFRGADVIPIEGGRFVTGINLMLSSPLIAEFSVFSWTFGPDPLDPDIKDPEGVASWGVVDAFGQQIVAFSGGGHMRSDPFTGTGWFPLDGSSTWAFIVLMGTSGPGEEEGTWEEHTTVQPFAAMNPEGLQKRLSTGIWMWAGEGGKPASCGVSIRCASLDDEQGGDFTWKGPPPFGWLAGAWTSYEAAHDALVAAGVDFKRGFYLLDSVSDEIHQEEGASLTTEAPMRDQLPYRAEEAP